MKEQTTNQSQSQQPKSINPFNIYKESLKQLQKYQQQKQKLEPLLQMDARGQKRILNRLGQEIKLIPYPNSFFFREESLLTQEEIAQKSYFNSNFKVEKQEYQKTYSLNPSSKIYNYCFRDLTLLRQIYQNQMDLRVKQQFSRKTAELQKKQKKALYPLVGIGALFVFTLPFKWCRLTSKHSQRIFVLFLLGQNYAIKLENTAEERYNSILRNYGQYEKIISLYEQKNNLD